MLEQKFNTVDATEYYHVNWDKSVNVTEHNI